MAAYRVRVEQALRECPGPAHRRLDDLGDDDFKELLAAPRGEAPFRVQLDEKPAGDVSADGPGEGRLVLLFQGHAVVLERGRVHFRRHDHIAETLVHYARDEGREEEDGESRRGQEREPPSGSFRVPRGEVGRKRVAFHS
ncbi:MAG: hypothetical protein A2Y36_03900 [Treponema sp. GWA1_62_8]|nr:MAG: hypothetical protein A2Y36_03900 [Treponema sp. GWA1_62_8]